MPVVALSARTGAGVAALLPAVAAVHDRWTKRVSTSRLNAWLAEVAADLRTRGRGGAVSDVARIRFIAQTASRPPTFVAFVRGGCGLGQGTSRLLTKRLRSQFGFGGVPLRLHARVRPASQRRAGGGRRVEGRPGGARSL